MDLNGKINEYLSTIRENYQAAKNFSVKEPKICAGVIRTTLEVAVKLLWLKKYNIEPTWLNKDGYESFVLYNAMVDSKVASLFNNITISDMHLIRKTCNDVLHDKSTLTVGMAQELLNRLEKCVEAIQSVIDLNVIARRDVNLLTKQKEIKAMPLVETNKNPRASGRNVEAEQIVFWDMLNKALDENGNPFFFVSRTHYAHINKSKLNSKVCLCLEFVVTKKVLRIGIYINNDEKTPHYDRLFEKREEIEEKLGFAPKWISGCKGSNTRRVAVELPFIPYEHEDYWRLIESALHKIVRYIDVCSIYLPEAFE